MSEKVRIPFTFVVKKVTWRPAGEALPEQTPPVLLTPHGGTLPVGVELDVDQATLDALTAQGQREYDAEKAAEAKAASRRAREAEAARWEPMPIPPGASRLDGVALREHAAAQSLGTGRLFRRQRRAGLAGVIAGRQRLHRRRDAAGSDAFHVAAGSIRESDPQQDATGFFVDVKRLLGSGNTPGSDDA